MIPKIHLQRENWMGSQRSFLCERVKKVKVLTSERVKECDSQDSFVARELDRAPTDPSYNPPSHHKMKVIRRFKNFASKCVMHPKSYVMDIR